MSTKKPPAVRRIDYLIDYLTGGAPGPHYVAELQMLRQQVDEIYAAPDLMTADEFWRWIRTQREAA